MAGSLLVTAVVVIIHCAASLLAVAYDRITFVSTLSGLLEIPAGIALVAAGIRAASRRTIAAAAS